MKKKWIKEEIKKKKEKKYLKESVCTHGISPQYTLFYEDGNLRSRKVY